MPAVFFTRATVIRGATVFTGATAALVIRFLAGAVDILNNFGAAGTFATRLATGAVTKVGAVDEVTTALGL